MNKSFLLRQCPKCSGDLVYDIDDAEYSCLQCGKRVNQKIIESLIKDYIKSRQELPRWGL